MSQRQVVAVLYSFPAICSVLVLAPLHPYRLIVIPWTKESNADRFAAVTHSVFMQL